ncbi:MAG: peptidylprolyl isomerase [Magnetococcales bacterium]|nr:peptidylprolyl isomerase [Magnetococcales bacterium]
MPFAGMKKYAVGWGWVVFTGMLLLSQGVLAKEDPGRKGNAVSGETVIASMGGVKLYTSELNRLFANSDARARTRVLTNPQLLEQTIREELFKKFILQQANTTGFDKQPQVQWAMERAGENTLLELYLNSRSRPEEQFPDEAMIKDAYEKNQAHFQVPSQAHLAQIFLPLTTDEKANKATTEKMNDLFNKAKKANADFAALAREHSQHSESAQDGGDMGWIPMNQMVPEVGKVVETMKAGEIKGPVQSPQGLHIIKLIESKPASVRSLEEAKPVLVAGLKKQRMETLRAQFLKDLLDKTPAIIDSANLSKLK